jgi:sulfatase modifying factor 1
MHRAVSFVVVLCVVASTVAACAAHPEAPAVALLPAGGDPREPPVARQPISPPAAAIATSPTACQGSSCRDPSCPDTMVLVEGDYCTEVREECSQWEDPPSNTLARCARFAPSLCIGAREHRRFCVDRDEYVPAGQALPMSDVSWTQARELCGKQSKRLCKETEWEFACEGEGMLPYPTGYERDARTCNFDKGNLVDRATGRLRDQRQPPESLDRCVSPFGVRNMSGNVDEWVWRDRTEGTWRSALKGGWWMPARDRCRPATTAHDEHYHELQTGVRCCADAPDG